MAFFAGTIFEGRWSDGKQLYGRELIIDQKLQFTGSYKEGMAFNGAFIQIGKNGAKLES